MIALPRGSLAPTCQEWDLSRHVEVATAALRGAIAHNFHIRKTTMIDLKKATQVAEILSGLAEVNRIRIVEFLRTGSKNVTQLATLLGVEIVNVSHHLKVLRETGLVQDDKLGRVVNYSLHPKVFNNTSSCLGGTGWGQLSRAGGAGRSVAASSRC
jgi:DNA-binding transcriptional ArsR family regulator